MDHRFDMLAKQLSGSVSRRQAFWRLGGGLVTALLASVGMARADQSNCAAACAHCCQNLDPPPRGQDLAVCITSCLEGGGSFPCVRTAVCP
jgi:hypothetical protein